MIPSITWSSSAFPFFAATQTSSANRKISSLPTGSSPCMFPRNANVGFGCVRPGSADTSNTRISSPFTLVPIDVNELIPEHGPACKASSADARSALERYRQPRARVAASTGAKHATETNNTNARPNAGTHRGVRCARIGGDRRDVVTTRGARQCARLDDRHK